MKHSVVCSAGELDVQRSAVQFRVRRGGRVLGRLRVSQGALVWIPKSRWRRGSGRRRYTWKKFDELMRNGKAS